ncbi:MAG: ABC transporter substrate-binding protein, partial [Thermomicrobiales bacterium]|nr:ABC transporter substrate-binding protein [Thermomicrobiales bacterium]
QLYLAPEAALAMQASGGQLIVGKLYELSSFDVNTATDQTAWEIHALVYEPLVFLDGEFNPIPGLAESWTVSDDNLTYTFKIREGVTFHNGRELTADDVLYTMNRVLDPATGAWWRPRLGPPAASTEEQLAADATAVAMGTPVAAVPGVGVSFEVTGPYEVTATLTEPYGAFLQALSPTVMSIVPSVEIESGEVDLNTDLMGTGPFKVVDHAEDQRWDFGRHEGYWQDGKPMVDSLVWQIMPDDSARVAALRSGDIHITAFENPLMLNLAQGDDTITIEQQLATNTYLMFVNSAHPELADPRVRQAISKGIDRDQIVSLAMSGMANLTGPVPAGFTQLASPVADIPNYAYDPEGAKALLAEAGVETPLKIRLLILPLLQVTVPMAELMKEQLSEIGIEIEIEQKDLATFVQEYAVDFTAMMTITWYAGFSDPYLFLLNFTSTATGPSVGATETTQIDLLLEQVSGLIDLEERKAGFTQIEHLMGEEAYFQFLASRNNFVAWRNDLLEGVTLASAEGFGLPYWH